MLRAWATCIPPTNLCGVHPKATSWNVLCHNTLDVRGFFCSLRMYHGNAHKRWLVGLSRRLFFFFVFLEVRLDLYVLRRLIPNNICRVGSHFRLCFCVSKDTSYKSTPLETLLPLKNGILFERIICWSTSHWSVVCFEDIHGYRDWGLSIIGDFRCWYEGLKYVLCLIDWIVYAQISL